MSTANLSLLKRLKEVSYLEGEFITRAGKPTSYYIDKYSFSTIPDILLPLCQELAQIMPDPSTYDRIAAPELGAVAIAAVLSTVVGKPFVIVRKQSKDYGTQKLIEGNFVPGETVAMIEDILTTGGAVLRACDIAIEAGLKVKDIVGVINREEGAEATIRERGFTMTALFTSSQLRTLKT